MTVQRSCHARVAVVLLGLTSLGASAETAQTDPAAHDYPTYARVEFVNECVAKGGKLSNIYQCSCALDHIAKRLTYDDFVEASTFARYSSLPGEGGALFRDPERAKRLAKLYRELEADAYGSCGLKV